MKYQNPIIPGFHPDPSVCRVGKDFYLVTSSFGYFPGIPIFHSQDLVHWEQIGHVLTRRSQLDLDKAGVSGGIYAPTIRYYDGLFWVIVTNVSSGGNFMVHAEDPRGAWSDPVWIDQGGIDPSLFFDDDGSVFYTGTHFTDDGLQGIGMFQIDIRTGEKLSDVKMIWHGNGGRCPEGPHLYKIGGVYYLMIAEGGTEYGHCETIARSDSVWGPYESCPHNPILSQNRLMKENCEIQGVGHADLIEDGLGNWWMVFLGHRLSELYFHHLGRETFLAPVTWVNGWPVVNAGEPILGEMDGPLPPEKRFPQTPRRCDFAKPLGPEWNWLRNPDDKCYVRDDKGILLSDSGTTLSGEGSPTFLGRRQEQFDMRCMTRLEPEQGEAGLTVFYDAEHHYDLLLQDGEIQLRKQVGDIAFTAYRAPWHGPCVLSVRADRKHYAFFYGDSDENQISAGTGLTSLVSTEATPISFTGVYIGIFAQNHGRARFNWFEYENLGIAGH